MIIDLILIPDYKINTSYYALHFCMLRHLKKFVNSKRNKKKKKII